MSSVCWLEEHVKETIGQAWHAECSVLSTTVLHLGRETSTGEGWPRGQEPLGKAIWTLGSDVIPS